MPNWCTTSYVFRGNENEIKDLYDKLKSFTSKERISNSFGNFWLGNIVNGFGFDYNEIPCRGRIDYFPELEETDPDRLEFSTWTAWEPMTEMWDKIIEKYYPSITYVLIVEECGVGIYINTDLEGEDFPIRFSVDFKLPPKYTPVCEYGFYADCEEELVEMFNNIFHRKYKSFKQCKKRLSKEFKKKEYRDKGYFLTIHKYEESL